MKLTDKQIDIYPSIWRVIGFTLISLLFVVGGFFMTNNPRIEEEAFKSKYGVK